MIADTHIIRAFAEAARAQRAVLLLALRIAQEGATAEDFPGFSLDAHIRRTLGEMHKARYEADVALCSFMRGEAYQPRPTTSAQAVEMQARVLRNERQTRGIPTGIPAVASVGSL